MLHQVFLARIQALESPELMLKRGLVLKGLAIDGNGLDRQNMVT